MDAPSTLPDIPEFDTWVGDDGRFYGRHKGTGRPISAPTADGLELAACAARIGITWTRAAAETRFTTGDLR